MKTDQPADSQGEDMNVFDDAVDEATNDFLERQHDLVLATTRRDGSPQISPVWYLWTGSSFLVSTVDWTAKWHNLKRDQRCAGCVDAPKTGQMVSVFGVADLYEDDVRDRTARLVEKYYPGDQAAADAHVARIFESGGRRVLIELVPDRIITRRVG